MNNQSLIEKSWRT